MKNRWNDEDAKAWQSSDLLMRVYTSRLLGQDDNLVLHGGGNTSVKARVKNIFGEEEDILYVKGSGWDLKTIEAPGFSPARLDVLKKLGSLPELTDTQMTRELKAALTDPGAPAPSVEAILHAVIPFRFVDHTHTDAVVAISNTENGEAILRELYGERLLILPYVMPGFILSKQVYEATRDIDWSSIDGIFLLHHGLFTFHDDARTSYDNMIRLVSLAEDYLKAQNCFDVQASASKNFESAQYVQLAALRQSASALFGHPMLLRWRQDEKPLGYAALANIESIATRGPVTPDHTIHTKRIAAILDEDNPLPGIDRFAADYQTYFDNNAVEGLTCLDKAPRFAVWKNNGGVLFAQNHKRLGVISDIFDHTIKCVQWGEALGGWKALSEKEIFELEYWELEQAKLKKGNSRLPMEGRVALVTGAASGIGKACVEALASAGAAVIATDINRGVTSLFSSSAILGLVCDITDTDSVRSAIEQGVAAFGGIDMLVSNAGAFPPSCRIESLDDEALEKSLSLNFNGHVRVMREALPFLKRGFDPSIVIMASKNVPAPGPGAGAYSAAKAALTQMMRVAALELGEFGIRVNALHPNAVFDTGVWTEEVLQKRAAHYGLSVEEYKTSNVLRTEITSADVAALVQVLCSPVFAKTTGAQIPIDGGNDRVI